MEGSLSLSLSLSVSISLSSTLSLSHSFLFSITHRDCHTLSLSLFAPLFSFSHMHRHTHIHTSHAGLNNTQSHVRLTGPRGQPFIWVLHGRDRDEEQESGRGEDRGRVGEEGREWECTQVDVREISTYHLLKIFFLRLWHGNIFVICFCREICCVIQKTATPSCECDKPNPETWHSQTTDLTWNTDTTPTAICV